MCTIGLPVDRCVFVCSIVADQLGSPDALETMLEEDEVKSLIVAAGCVISDVIPLAKSPSRNCFPLRVNAFLSISHLVHFFSVDGSVLLDDSV